MCVPVREAVSVSVRVRERGVTSVEWVAGTVGARVIKNLM